MRFTVKVNSSWGLLVSVDPASAKVASSTNAFMYTADQTGICQFTPTEVEWKSGGVNGLFTRRAGFVCYQKAQFCGY